MDDLKIIKNKYGEKMMHFCRKMFPTFLETPGELSEALLSSFYPSKFLYDDLVSNNKLEDFRRYIYGIRGQMRDSVVVTNKTPKQLLEEANYDLYECLTEEDIQYFKKYYSFSEELCTFNGGRLNSCYVFFAVKKNVNEIKREKFKKPIREDEYGTSVISIQFNRSVPNTLSIKNRYNHTVTNPDNTYNNNLDNIIPGLNESFRREYDLDFEIKRTDFDLPGYVYVYGKFYKYNNVINNKYYCADNIVIDNFNVIDRYRNEPERYIVFDYYVIDLKEKKVFLHDRTIGDSFIGEFEDISKIDVIRDKSTGNKKIHIFYKENREAVIVINKFNQMIEYHNNYQKVLGWKSLFSLSNLVVVDMPDLEIMCSDSLNKCPKLLDLNCPNLVEMGDNCLKEASSLVIFEAPKLVKMDIGCLKEAPLLTYLTCPNLVEMGGSCFNEVDSLEYVTFDRLVEMGGSCFTNASSLIKFSAPNLKSMSIYCLKNVRYLEDVFVPKLEYMDDGCFKEITKLKEFNAPNLYIMGNSCFKDSFSLTSFIAPQLKVIGNGCFSDALFLENFITSSNYEINDDMNFGCGRVVYTFDTSDSLSSVIDDIIKNGEFEVKDFKNKEKGISKKL